MTWVICFATFFPTLLAYSQTPASTLYNQLLAWLTWGVVLVVGGRAQHRLNGKLLMATLLLGAAAAYSALRLGEPGSEMATLGLLAGAVALTAVASAERHGQWAGLGAGLALGCLMAGTAGLLIGCIQVFLPHLADGEWVARSGLSGRAVGNVRQPNHLATLLLMGAVGAVWLGVMWRRHWLVGALLLGALVFGIVLTASRTGLWFGVPLLVLWGLVDRELPKPWRLLLLATPLMAALSWWGLHLWAESGAGVFGAEARLDQEGAGSPSRIAILKNAWALLLMHPWTGVGWGEFNRAWTLTPFPDRPVAFFDHTHNLPLQLLVELGWPLGLTVLGLLLAALWQALRLAQQARGEDAVQRRAAFMLVLVVGVHSMLEYPLWYAYFLLPTTLAWGLALAPASSALAPSLHSRWPRCVGALMIAGSLYAFLEYRHVAAIYAPAAQDRPLAQRIERGQRTLLLSRHADYAAATAMGTGSAALAAAQRTGHQLIDARLLIAWAKSLHAAGETDKARYLVARLREFRSRDGEAWLKRCVEDPAEWMCEAPTGRYSWKDF
ncbi:Wzy polymerase domain-containing protein [Inhella sp.]|uniref:PglL family O-oligosaccharyltransferase n=1 Tax=Inhella sp. TaxID=1921806 RepID=UPI0035B01AE5